MWFFVVVIMVAIFLFSSQTGVQSSQVSDKIVNVIENQITKPSDTSSKPPQSTSSDTASSNTPVTPPVEENLFLITLVRKSAHFLIFATLGFFLYGALCTYKGGYLKHTLLSFTLGVIYALSDEFHQRFVDGRSANVMDVLIDSLGVVIGIGLMLAIVLIYKKIKSQKALGI